MSCGAVVEIKTKQQVRATSFHLANRTASHLRNNIVERVLWVDFRNGLNPVFGPARSASPCCFTSQNVERFRSAPAEGGPTGLLHPGTVRRIAVDLGVAAPSPDGRLMLVAIGASIAAAMLLLVPGAAALVGLDPDSGYHLGQIIGMLWLYHAVAGAGG